MNMNSMIDTAWNALIDYESRDLVERVYQQRHGRSLSVSATHEITSSFIQAREYYLNASRAAITVRPLLQYYGVIALTRGLTLLLMRGMSASALKPSHGLNIKDWGNLLSGGLSSISDLEVVICEGAFLYLLRSTNNKSYLKANSSGVNWALPFEIPQAGQSFTLQDIARSIPDIEREYKVWKDEDFVSVKLDTFLSDRVNEKFEIKVPSNTSMEFLARVFPENRCRDLQIVQDGEHTVITFASTYVPYFTQSNGWLGIGDVTIVPPLKSGIYLNTLSLYFGASYILSMLARYFPATWIALGRVEKGDAISPLVNKLMELIQSKFPQLVLEFLNSPYPFEVKVEG